MSSSPSQRTCLTLIRTFAASTIAGALALCLQTAQARPGQVAGAGVWIPAGTRTTNQQAVSAVQLTSGSVVVAGYESDAVDIYDPLTWSWSRGPNLLRARSLHSLTALNDGGILAVGGLDVPRFPFTGEPQAYGAERFDAQGLRWYGAGDGLLYPKRTSHVAVMLASGKVLVAGGCELDRVSECFLPLTNSQLYDPQSNRWENTGSLNQARYLASAVRLSDGRVLIMGGVSEPGKTWDFMSGLRSAELYNPSDGTWSLVADMQRPRFINTATLLSDGQVLIAGNSTSLMDNPPLEPKREGTSEIYDPATGEWSHLVDMVGPSDVGIDAVALGDGRVLVAGGAWLSRIGSPKFAAQVYDPVAHAWSLVATCTTTSAGMRMSSFS